MAENAKITDEQLKKLQENISKLNQYNLQLGQIESQKHLLLHETANVQKELNEYQKTLEDEYGKVSINIQDGTYVVIPKENESNQKNQYWSRL